MGDNVPETRQKLTQGRAKTALMEGNFDSGSCQRKSRKRFI